jgi:hypothetical protein
MPGRNLGFGSGIWLSRQFVDRYATDACGSPVGTLEAIVRAARAADIVCPVPRPRPAAVVSRRA